MKTIQLKDDISQIAADRISTLQTAPVGEYLVSRSNYNSRGSSDLTIATVGENSIVVYRERIRDKSDVWARVQKLTDVRLVAVAATA